MDTDKSNELVRDLFKLVGHTPKVLRVVVALLAAARRTGSLPRQRSAIQLGELSEDDPVLRGLEPGLRKKIASAWNGSRIDANGDGLLHRDEVLAFVVEATADNDAAEAVLRESNEGRARDRRLIDALAA